MRSEANSLMISRAENTSYTHTSIRNVSIGRDSRAVQLIDRIFGLLPAVYGDPLKRQAFRTNIGVKDGLTDSWIGKEFYTNHYCPVTVKKDYGGTEVTLDDLILILTEFDSEARNHLFFLQSGVGAGKTALINHIITKYGEDLFRSKGVWFLRLNVDVLRSASDRGLDGFFKSLEQKLFIVIKKLLDRHQGDSLSVEDIASLREVLTSIPGPVEQDLEGYWKSHLYKTISAISDVLGRRLLLIIDNLDFIVHQRDRYQFLNSRELLDDEYLLTIRSIVSSFYQPDSSLSDIGANVLFAVRPDTYHLMKTTNLLVPMARAPFVDNRSLYTLVGPSWDDVVYQRASLLAKCVEKVQPDGVKQELKRHTDPLIRALQDAPRRQRLFDHLRHMSVYGLRGVLTFFSDYTWYPAHSSSSTPTVTTRFLDSYQLGLLAFMLNGRLIYTQNEAQFPNIFFSNISSDEESQIIDQPVNNSQSSRKIRKSHWHTYWLKRLLLEFIRARNASGASTKPDDIYEVFCLGDDGLGFTEDLVRLCLGSFSQTHVSDLISVNREITGDRDGIKIENIRLSDRALHCMDKVFDTFPYLQIVVDDYLLPIPKRWVKDFEIPINVNYSYLSAPNEQFFRGARQMINHKAYKVTRFLAIINEAFEAEKLSKPNMFSRLADEGVKLPSTRGIAEGVWRELAALTSSGGGGVDVENLRRLFEAWRADIRPDIFAAYGLDPE